MNEENTSICGTIEAQIFTKSFQSVDKVKKKRSRLNMSNEKTPTKKFYKVFMMYYAIFDHTIFGI